MRRHATLLLLVLALVGLLAAPSAAVPPTGTPGVPEREVPGKGAPPSWSGKAFRQGVVSVSHPLAAEAGAAMLEAGGNAIDAAAAVQFALNVVEPHFSGIGGGGFMMVHLARAGETFVVDSRERAPMSAGPDYFQGLTFATASQSGISVGVPGTLLGVATALERHGTMDLTTTLGPAVELAAEGFPVNQNLASNSASARVANYAETRAIFRRPDGSPLQVGDILVQPDLANTFRLIAEQGVDVFYRGEIAEAIVAAQQRAIPGGRGGEMTLEDLATYDIAISEPVEGDYRGFTVKSMGPPSSGGLTVVQMLKMLERFPLGDPAAGYGFGTTNTLHAMIEAMRLAYADRAIWMGDEDFVPVPKAGLLADEYVALRSAMITPGVRMATPSAGDPWTYEPSALTAVGADNPDGHTTHFSVVDKWGNVVSYTTTIEAGWGTGITVPGYGFLLNNELTDFNLTPTRNDATGNPGANDVAGGKRPRSSMSPTMLFKDGRPIAAYGSPGGATIINSVLQITLNLVDHGMAIQEAIDAPRISVTSPVGTVSREAGFPADTISGLQAIGHPLANPSTIGSVQAVGIDLLTGKQYGGADQRREGTVIGLPRPRGGPGR
jgi:gamma-glutamyltranspeptidase / glutathione hydrolase